MKYDRNKEIKEIASHSELGKLGDICDKAYLANDIVTFKNKSEEYLRMFHEPLDNWHYGLIDKWNYEIKYNSAKREVAKLLKDLENGTVVK
jgi:hypothetical protein